MRPGILAAVALFAACEVANPAYDMQAKRADDAGDSSEALVGGEAGASQAAAGSAGSASVGGNGGGSPSNGGNKALAPDAATDTKIAVAPDGGTEAGVTMPSSRPILEYLFTQGSGTTILDTSGLANHGQAKCVNACTNGPPTWRHFDGILGMELAYYQAIQVNDSRSLSSLNGDFSFFLHARRLDHPGIRPIASRLTSDKKSTVFLFSFDDGHLSARVGNVRVSDPQTAPGNTWMYIGVRRQNGTLSVFRDGVRVDAPTLSTLALSSSEPFWIGAAFLDQVVDQAYADAVIDDLVIYNRALTDSEVNKLRMSVIPQ